MIRISRVADPASMAGRTIVMGMCLAALLAALGGCAAGNATSSLATPAIASATPTTTTAAAAPTQPAPAAAPATAPAAPPQHLTATEINEKCWMRTEKFKSDNLDKRMKLVDKCVEEMTRAQGGV